ncbi:hypothetical protein Pst134EB_016822 [Puccinia striiformis f. sp. tritici]|nr:hypothetical protein Pst134EB_016822 [Puccinia striiformis f. sp. tritici]
MNSHPTRIKIISSAAAAAAASSPNQNNSNNSLKRKTSNEPATTTTKKITLRLRPPPPPQQQQPSSSSSSSSPLPPNSLDQINQIRSYGLQLWHQIVNSTDQNGRPRAIAFMDLPSAVDYPDYYQFIKHPMALNPIKSKLESDHDPYLSLDKLLSDLKLVFSNAKKYNVEQSGIYKDAQALMKIVRKDPFASVKEDGQQNQSEIAEPKQKKLKIKLRPSQAAHQISPTTAPTNGIDPTPTTLVIPPTPIEPASQNGKLAQVQAQPPPTAPSVAAGTRVQTDSQPAPPQVASRPKTPSGGQLPSMSSEEINRIQAELKVQTEARNRAQEESKQKQREEQLRLQEESRKAEAARQFQLRQQAQTRQLELRQQAEAQQASSRTQATRVQPQSQQSGTSVSAQIPVQAAVRSPARIQVQRQLQSPSRLDSAQSLLPTSPTTNRVAQTRTSPRGLTRPTTPTPSSYPPRISSPSPSSKPKSNLNLNKLKLWIRTLIENLEGLTDRTGRPFIEEFKTLPDKNRWKSYYAVIPDPIAFDNIHTRNNRTGYKDFTSFFDDVSRVFRNARHFNEHGSMVWNDSKVLENKFAELIRRPPQELCEYVLPYLQNKTKVDSSSGPINGQRKSPGKEGPTSSVGPSSTLVAPVAVPGLRRSSRSPSRPPSAIGSPVTRASRAVSPLPRRAAPPLGPPKKLPSLPSSSTVDNSSIAAPTRPVSRLSNDISPALISISNPMNSLANKFAIGLKVRSMNVIPVKSSDGYPPMINRFRIISRPKTMETLKIKNRRVFQHCFTVPKTSETIIIESELNKSWPNTRQLRSSSIGLIKVKIDQIRVRGIPERLTNYQQQQQTTNGNGGNENNGGGGGLVFTEVKLTDGLNLIEFNVTGKPDANKNDLGSSLSSVPVNGVTPINGTTTSTISSIPVLPATQSSLVSAATTAATTNSGEGNGSFVKEFYRLFIYR